MPQCHQDNILGNFYGKIWIIFIKAFATNMKVEWKGFVFKF